MSQIATLPRRTKNAVRNQILRMLVPEGCRFSIVCEECWGGVVYQLLNREYETPFIGLWVSCDTYVDLLEALPEVSKETLRFVEQDDVTYPVAWFGPAKLGFLHYTNEDEARTKFVRRQYRFCPEASFVKIDFRYQWYTQDHIDRWNKLMFPRSIAFVEVGTERAEQWIHNSVLVGPKVEFQVDVRNSLQAFCWWDWLETGRLRKPTVIERMLSDFLLRR